jgi:DNA transformation protein and related proteins
MPQAELPDFVAHCIDVLDAVGPVRVRRMFGGWGVYVRERMFGLIADETLYLKADDINRPDFVVEGLGPFVYETSGGKHNMSYYQAPPEAMEDRQTMRPWALGAIGAADRAVMARASKAKKPATKTKSLPNLGPKSAEWLADIGVTTPEQLARMGAVVAYARIKAQRGTGVSLNLLYALHGALVGERWDRLSGDVKKRLADAAKESVKQLKNKPKAKVPKGRSKH